MGAAAHLRSTTAPCSLQCSGALKTTHYPLPIAVQKCAEGVQLPIALCSVVYCCTVVY